jgi:hypothetical protein
MSRTKKDAKPTRHFKSKIRVGHNLKTIARAKKHSVKLKAIDDPKTLKRTAANEWDIY